MVQQIGIDITRMEDHQVTPALVSICHRILYASKGVGLVCLKISRHIGVHFGVAEGYCLAGTAHRKVGQAVPLGNDFQSLKEIGAGHCVSLKIARFAAGPRL